MDAATLPWEITHGDLNDGCDTHLVRIGPGANSSIHRQLLGIIEALFTAFGLVAIDAIHGTGCFSDGSTMPWADVLSPAGVVLRGTNAADRLTGGAGNNIVSYADPSAGHRGTIYQAANWKADGRTDDERKSPRCDYYDDRTGQKYGRRGNMPADAVIARASNAPQATAPM